MFRNTCKTLTTNVKLFNDFLISLFVFFLQVVEKVAAFADHLHQTQTGVQVFAVNVEVLNQVVDAGRPDRDLNFRRTGVAFGQAVSFGSRLSTRYVL